MTATPRTQARRPRPGVRGAPAPSRRSGTDPLAYAMLLAVAFHGAAILGITFEQKPRPDPPPHQTLRVVVVRPQPKPPQEVEEPELLAQENRRGDERPDEAAAVDEPDATPLAQDIPPPPLVIPVEAEPRLVVPPPEPEPEPAPPPAPEVAETPEPEPTPEPQPPPPPPRIQAQRPATEAAPPPKPARRQEPAPPSTIGAAELLASRNAEIDRLTEELDRKTNAYAQRTRRKAVSASTTEYRYAAYLDAWRRKVENIGNLNYPDEARRKKLYGNLVLHVAVRSDGSVERIRLLHSSGHKVLDDAAMRIVRLAAPYAPFPPDILAETDVLDITRTWQFLSSNRLGWGE